MPETVSDQLFPDDAVTGSGRFLCATWPIDRPVLAEVLAALPVTSPQAEQLPLDSDEMRSAA